MPEFKRVATAAEIPPGHSKTFEIGEYEIAVFNIKGEFFAIENTCPHQGGPLAEGWIDGHVVTCPWHAWCFDIRDGSMTIGDGFDGVGAFDVRVDDGELAIATSPRLRAT